MKWGSIKTREKSCRGQWGYLKGIGYGEKCNKMASLLHVQYHLLKHKNYEIKAITKVFFPSYSCKENWIGLRFAFLTLCCLKQQHILLIFFFVDHLVCWSIPVWRLWCTFPVLAGLSYQTHHKVQIWCLLTSIYSGRWEMDCRGDVFLAVR